MYQFRLKTLFFIYVLPALVQADAHVLKLLTPQFPALHNGSASRIPQVVPLMLENGTRFCSSTVVGARTIVTAAHCATPGKVIYTEVEGRRFRLQCQRHTSYQSDDSDEKRNALRAIAQEAKSLCESARNGAKEALQQMKAKVAQYFQKRRETVSLNDSDLAADLAVCWVSGDETFPVEPACLKNYREPADLMHVGWGTTGVDAEGKLTNPNLMEQNSGPANVNLAKSNAVTIETQFSSTDPNSSGILPGDSGGFLGSRSAGQCYISGVHSSASTNQLRFNEVACRFDNYIIANASATSVSLFSPSAQGFLNQMTQQHGLEICGLNGAQVASTPRPQNPTNPDLFGRIDGRPTTPATPNGVNGAAIAGRPGEVLPTRIPGPGQSPRPGQTPMPATRPAQVAAAGIGFSLVDSSLVRITKVAAEGYAASKMGLQPGDKIIGWDGTPLANSKDFISRWRLLMTDARKTGVVLTVQKADGTLKRYGIRFPPVRSGYDLMARRSIRLGLSVDDDTSQSTVAGLSPSGMGGELKMGKGDVLLSVNDQKVNQSEDANKAIEVAKTSDQEFKLSFIRPDGSNYSIFMDPKKIKTNLNFVATR